MVKSIKKDKLAVNIYENRTLMGEAAANDIAACMEKLLSQKDTINMVFAAGIMILKTIPATAADIRL